VGQTVILLPAALCIPDISEAAEFCLQIAANHTSDADIIILGGALTSEKIMALTASFSAFFKDNRHITVTHHTLDTLLWPDSAANNALLEPALTAYDALRHRDTDVLTLFSPLSYAASYFILHAQKGGLGFQNIQTHQTVYSPISLQRPGQLCLPTELSDVVDSAIEIWTANHADKIYITHDSLRTEIIKRLNICSKKIQSPHHIISCAPLDNLRSRHLIFCGSANPFYGFDAFCDLVETRAKKSQIKRATIIIDTHDPLDLLSAAKTRLAKLPIDIDWKTRGQCNISHLDTGVIIAPMRAPCCPLSLLERTESRHAAIWGTGFALSNHAVEHSGHITQSVSDIRKIETLLDGQLHLKKQTVKTVKSKLVPAAKPRPKPSVSVILTHRDRPEFVIRTLGSLRDQTLKSFELIVVDDGSAPDNQQILQQAVNESGLKHTAVHFIDNSYPAYARNYGARQASGEALFFIDDDNIIAPETLTAFQQAMTRSDVVLSFFQTFRSETELDNTKSPSPNRPKHSNPAYAFAGAHSGIGLFHNLCGNSSLMVRRSVFERLGGFTEHFGIGLEDYGFVLRCAAEDFVVLPEPYLHFRDHMKKIRLTHVDWRANARLQAGHWRIMDELGNIPIPTIAIAYARQLHEMTQYQYVPLRRPDFFRLHSVLIHQYIRPFLARRIALRRGLNRWAASQGPLYKLLAGWLFPNRR